MSSISTGLLSQKGFLKSTQQLQRSKSANVTTSDHIHRSSSKVPSCIKTHLMDRKDELDRDCTVISSDNRCAQHICTEKANDSRSMPREDCSADSDCHALDAHVLLSITIIKQCKPSGIAMARGTCSCTSLFLLLIVRLTLLLKELTIILPLI